MYNTEHKPHSCIVMEALYKSVLPRNLCIKVKELCQPKGVGTPENILQPSLMGK